MKLRVIAAATFVACLWLAMLSLCTNAAGEPTTAKVVEPADVPSIHHPTSDNHLKSVHAKFLQRIKDDNKIQLLFLGDSITAGWANAPDVWKEYYGQYDPANFGDGGDYTQHLLWRIDNGELEDINPKVVVLLIGINNLYHNPGNTPEQTAAGIKKILDTIHERLPETKVLLLGLFPYRDKNSGPRAACVAVNAIISKFDDGTKTRYLGLWDQFLQPDGSISREVMKDGLHPTPYGYQILAKNMDPLLCAMMGVTPAAHAPVAPPAPAAPPTTVPAAVPVMRLPIGPVTTQVILATDFSNADAASYEKDKVIGTGDAAGQLTVQMMDYPGMKVSVAAADGKHALEFTSDGHSTTAHATYAAVKLIPKEIANQENLVMKGSVLLSVLPLPAGVTRGTLGIILFSNPQRFTTGPACISTIMMPQSFINGHNLAPDKKYHIEFTVDFSDKTQHGWQYTIAEEGKEPLFSSGVLPTRDPQGVPAMFALTAAGSPFIHVYSVNLTAQTPPH